MFFVWPSVATALLRNYCQNWWDWVGGHLEHCYLLYPTCLYLRACYKPINHPLGTASFTLLSGLCPKLEASVVRASNRAVGRAFDNTCWNNLRRKVLLPVILPLKPEGLPMDTNSQLGVLTNLSRLAPLPQLRALHGRSTKNTCWMNA